MPTSSVMQALWNLPHVEPYTCIHLACGEWTRRLVKVLVVVKATARIHL